MTGLLLIGLLSAHLLVVNLASAGPLLCCWLGRRPTAAPADAPTAVLRDALGRRLAWWSVAALVLGIVTGAVQLYGAVPPSFFAALDRLAPAELWFAAAEIAFSLVCLLLYASTWDKLRNHRWLHASLALLSSSNLLYHFPPLMSVLAKLSHDPNWAAAPRLNRQALLPLMQRSEIVALSTHFLLASVAVAAVTVLWLVSRTRPELAASSAQPIARRAAWVALLASALQLPVGGWLLVSLSRPDRMAMTGGSLVASLAFAGALVVTFVFLQRLLQIAIQPSDTAQLNDTAQPSDTAQLNDTAQPNDTAQLDDTAQPSNTAQLDDTAQPSDTAQPNHTAQSRALRSAGWLLACLVLLMTITLVVSRAPAQPRAEPLQRASTITPTG